MDTDDVERLFREHHGNIRRILGGQCRLEDADRDDLAMLVFERLLRYPTEDLERIKDPLAFLSRIALNIVSEWRELIVNSRPHDADWLDDLQIGDTPATQAEQDTESRLVREAVDQLPELERKTILLAMNEDLTQEQIAARLGLSRRMVLRNFQNGYTRLRYLLGGQKPLKQRVRGWWTTHTRPLGRLR